VSAFYQAHAASGDAQSFGMNNALIFWTVTSPLFIGAIFVADLAEERPLYTRDLADALYRPASLVAYKLLTELPALITSTVLYAAIVYPLLHLRAGWDAFAFFLLALFVNQAISLVFCYALAATLKGAELPMAVLPCCAMLNTLAAGYWVPGPNVSVVWRWLYTISPLQWLFSALMQNQYRGAMFQASLGGLVRQADVMIAKLMPTDQADFWEGALLSTTRLLNDPSVPGETVLISYGLLERSKWRDLGLAAISFPVCLCLFYAGVRWVRHDLR